MYNRHMAKEVRNEKEIWQRIQSEGRPGGISRRKDVSGIIERI